ncbi:MAG: hydroxyacid dehydrogenase [Actinomycetia bacterium]|nr:hydroxyacid dehydrogenase [Actinomycetes bacterium]
MGSCAFSTPELIEAAAGCEAIVTHRGTPFPAEVFDALPDLVAVFRCAVDISDIDVDAASANGVLVGRAAKSFVPSTAELALGLYLDPSRSIAESTVDYHKGVEPPQRPGRQLRGQTAGIVGYGAIGTYLADLLAASDVVFPLAHSTPATENLIDATVLAKMKPGASLLNVSRGELLDEHAVAAALDSRHLGGLAMDVGRAADQRPSPDLAARAGVVATPHLGGLTPENAFAQAASSVEQIEVMLVGEAPTDR